MYEPDIKYTLIAEVDGELVFKGEYVDTAGLQEDLYKPELAVERQLKELEEDNG